MSEHESAVWPSDQVYLRPVVCTGYLLTLCVLAVFFTQRVGTWEQFKRLRAIPLLVAILLFESLLFVLISAVILLGVGSSESSAACSTAIWLCVILYATTKAVLYVLLLEKLHVVHCNGPAGKTPRFNSWWYRSGLGLFLLWATVAVLMIVGRAAFIRQDGACVIGLRLYATIPMLCVDATTNIYLTTGFVIPIWKSNFPKAQRLARISAIAAVAALITSFANVLLLTLEKGHQLSFVCLGACGLDVAFNSCAVFLVTSSSRQRDEAGSTSDGHNSTSLTTKTRQTNLFRPKASIGVHIIEEVHVDTNADDIHLSSMARPLPQTSISFADSRAESWEDEKATVRQ